MKKFVLAALFSVFSINTLAGNTCSEMLRERMPKYEKRAKTCHYVALCTLPLTLTAVGVFVPAISWDISYEARRRAEELERSAQILDAATDYISIKTNGATGLDFDQVLVDYFKQNVCDNMQDTVRLLDKINKNEDGRLCRPKESIRTVFFSILLNNFFGKRIYGSFYS